MSLIVSIIDKILFGALLVLTFQIPVLSDQYLQFTTGYFESLKVQVDGYKQNAERHEYSDVHAMVNSFLENQTPAVRYDGEQKLQALREYEDLQQALVLLKTGNVFQRAWYMFNPKRGESLKKVLSNFSPAIPLAIMDILYCILVSLLLSFIGLWPVRAFAQRYKKNQ